jgi:hypothetical protein
MPADIDARRHPRFKLEVDSSIHSRTCVMLNGRSVDISESGIAAMLRLEVPVGEVVELNFSLPSGPATTRALVRQRNAFRYGFEFVDSHSVRKIVRRTCRDLAVEQSLMPTDCFQHHENSFPDTTITLLREEAERCRQWIAALKTATDVFSRKSR